MSKEMRWGILGTGSIAKQFARGLQAVPDARLVAVGSRTGATADAFGKDFNAPKRHASYEALAADPEVDAIYVSTPHPMHKDNTILCLKAGKAVLCEKPFAMNAREAEEMLRVARDRKVFLMEAMWTRFIPIICRVREWLSQGAIGEVKMLTGDFGFRAGFDPKSRLFDPKLGGGALLDVGIYVVSFASMVYGEQPARIASMAHFCETGVDDNAAMILGYGRGQLAALSTSVCATTPHEVWILGTEGKIKIHAPFWKATTATLSRDGKGSETIELPHTGNGYNYEAVEVGDCVRAGKLESATMPLDESLAIMKTMDTIRAQWGLKYPME
ncbi:MAG: Gfo/Idh/MocA family oxidoreductase [Candidatus Hydrogenedentes bacterium]|nr:Gfo/Idh/MocA family oxidoreductase [Candidatus Hydrogenedentota bacterium]